MRKAGIMIAALALLQAVNAQAQANAAQNPQQKLREIQQEIRQSEERRKALEAEAKRLADELGRLRAEAVAAAEKVHAQERAVSDMERRIRDLKKREAELSSGFQTRRRELAQTLDSLAFLSRQRQEALLFAPRPAFDTVRASQTVAAIVPELETRAQKIKADLDTLAQVQEKLHTEQIALKDGLEDLETERAKLNALRQRTDEARRQTLAERQEEARRAQALAREARDIETLIRRLAEEDRRRRAEAARRAQAEKERDFVLREGSAALPAQGRIVGRFNQKDENGGTLRGIRIETRSKAQVVAPAEGRVAFSGPFRGYGNLLIIAHGGGYHSLLSGLGRLDAKVGQEVAAGEPVGIMDESNSAPILYVELRRQGEAVNPLPWLAAADRTANR